MALNARQQKFVAEYIMTFNATQAAVAAGYSEKTAYAIGSENLKKPEIAQAIKQFLDGYAMPAEEVLFHLAEIARGDFDDISDSAGFLDMQKAKHNRKTRLIKRTKQRTTTGENHESHEVEVEMYDRLTALGLLAKYHNLTNKVVIEDWRTEAINLIRTGQLEFKSLADEMGISLAEELFISAGVQLTDAGTASESRREE